MHRLYKGNVSLQYHSETGALAVAADTDGRFDADNITDLLNEALDFCDREPMAGFCGYTFYIHGMNLRPSMKKRLIPPYVVEDAIARGDVPMLEVSSGRTNRPKVVMAGPVKRVCEAEERLVLL